MYIRRRCYKVTALVPGRRLVKKKKKKFLNIKRGWATSLA